MFEDLACKIGRPRTLRYDGSHVVGAQIVEGWFDGVDRTSCRVAQMAQRWAATANGVLAVVELGDFVVCLLIGVEGRW